MRPHSLLFRLTATTTATALLLTPVVPLPAVAQIAPPLVGAEQQQAGDPPARVGRLARTTGAVSLHTAEADQWSPAALNFPVASGEGFWTEPSGQAEIQIDASRIQLAGGTDFEVGVLDENGLQATEGQGETYLHLRDVAPNEAWSVQTPRGLVTLAGDGRYAIVAGDTDNPTTVTVLEGSAQVSGPGLALQVGPGQAATIAGSDTFEGSVGPAQPDAFITAMLQRERPPPVPAVAPPPAVAMMPGGADLAAYGSWSDAPDYGPVWYPQVAPGWVPYREGHWAWVAPWGWTWVDDAPWGFAPFHYGRWVEIGGRWGWTPGEVVVAGPPVYAPALVTFFGVAAGVGLAAALAAGSVGWCPLGPREAYHPWYRASDRYWRQVNIRNVTNITTINRTVVINNYRNRGAATVVPASVMQASRPVRPAAARVDPRMLTSAHAVVGRDPVAPSRATFGVTPATARHVTLAPTPPGAAPRHAPGPAIRPVLAPGAVRPQQPGAIRPQQPNALVRPPLAGPGGTHAAPPAGTPGRPAPAVVTPGVRPPVAPSVQRPIAPAPGHPATPGTVQPHAPPLLHPGERPSVPLARPAPSPAAGTPPLHQPNAAVRPTPPTAVRPLTAQPSPGAAAPHVATPAPHVTTPTPHVPPAAAAPRPAPQTFRPPAPTQQYRPPTPAPQVHPSAPAPQTFRPAAPAQQFRSPTPAPQVHQPPPAPHFQAPAPQVRQPPPAPHFQAPPPQIRQPPPAPRPAPQPQFHPPQVHVAPPAAQHPPPQQQERQKRPGER